MSRETLERFYRAFAARDPDTMASCYAADATFQDPVFRLSGGDIGDMWRMLIGRGPELEVDSRILDPTHATCSARYRFAGRPVRNEIHSSFAFDDAGLVVRQVDSFDFARWARQALGWKGWMFGRFGFFRKAVRRRAAASLERWQRRRAADGPASR